jgi:hypothetical protein
MKTVLALGSERDACLKAVVQEVAHRGVEVVFVDQTRLADDLGMSLLLSSGDAEGSLVVRQRRLPLAQLGGVLARLGPACRASLHDPDDEQQYIQFERMAAMFGLFEALSCPVINPFRPVWLPGPTCLSWQLARAVRDSGFQLPPSGVASDGAAELFERHGRRALTGPPLFDRPLLLAGEEGQQLLRDRHGQSGYVQIVPPGRWLRILVAAGQAFAAEADPLASGDAPWPTAVLPASCAAQCRRLAGLLQLELFELAVLHGDDGHDYCFSLDERPFWQCREEVAGRQITAILADELTRDVRRAAA